MTSSSITNLKRRERILWRTGVLVIAVVVVAVVVVVAATAAIIAAVKNTLHDEDE